MSCPLSFGNGSLAPDRQTCVVVFEEPDLLLDAQLLAVAQGSAAQFDAVYAQYRLAPEVTRKRIYLETMESVLSKVDKTVIEPGNVQTYLPLPEVRRRALPAPAAPAPTVQAK